MLVTLNIQREKWAQADALAYQAYDLANDLGNQELIASSCCCLAIICLSLNNDSSKSIRYASRAVEIFTRLHHVDLDLSQAVLNTAKKTKTASATKKREKLNSSDSSRKNTRSSASSRSKNEKSKEIVS